MQTQRDGTNEAPEVEDPPETAGAPETEGAPDPEVGADDDAGIEIDGQKFATEAEALAYAKSQLGERDTKLAISESYQAGLLDAQRSSGAPAPAAAAPVEDEDPQFEEKFYANPRAALREVEERATKKALRTVDSALSAQANDRQLWETFSGLHPDLADFREDVDRIANDPRHTQIAMALAQTKGQPAAMDYIAQKTRAKFQAYAAASKQTTVLPRGGAGPTPAGAAKSVTPPKKVEKPLSMREQLAQHKAKSHKY